MLPVLTGILYGLWTYLRCGKLRIPLSCATAGVLGTLMMSWAIWAISRPIKPLASDSDDTTYQEYERRFGWSTTRTRALITVSVIALVFLFWTGRDRPWAQWPSVERIVHVSVLYIALGTAYVFRYVRIFREPVMRRFFRLPLVKRFWEPLLRRKRS